MPGPTTIFDADECQALLDLIDKLRVRVGRPGSLRREDITEEETRAFAKLEFAGKFYIKGDS